MSAAGSNEPPGHHAPEEFSTSCQETWAMLAKPGVVASPHHVDKALPNNEVALAATGILPCKSDHRKRAGRCRRPSCDLIHGFGSGTLAVLHYLLRVLESGHSCYFFRAIAATSSWGVFGSSTDCYLDCGPACGTPDVVREQCPSERGGQIGARLQICRYFRIPIAYDRRPTRQASNSLRQAANFHRDQ